MADIVLCTAVEGCLTAIYAFVILVRRARAAVTCPCVLQPAHCPPPTPAPNVIM